MSCELRIEDIPVNKECPGNDDLLLFTSASGLSELRRWSKLKECLNNGLLTRADIRFRIGDGGTNTPPEGTQEYRNIDLAGIRYRLFRRGVGYLQEGVEFIIFPEGGFRLSLPGDVFSEGEVFHLQEYETIVSSTDGGLFQNILTVNNDITLSKLHANFLFEIAGGNNRVRIELPDLAVVAPFSMWAFSINSNNAYQVTIGGNAGIVFRGKVRSAIFLGNNENIVLMPGMGKWFVFTSNTSYGAVGRPVFDYVVRENSVIAEGQIVSRLDFPRVTEFILENPACVVTETVWKSHPVAQRQLFSSGDNVTTLRLPDLRGLFFRTLDRGRGLDEDTPAASGSGRYQEDGVGKHKHESEEFSDRGWPKQSADRTDKYYFIHKDKDSGNLRRLAILEGGGKETRGKNVGLLGLINI